MTAPYAFASQANRLREVGQVKQPEIDMLNSVFYGAMRLVRSRKYTDMEVAEWIGRHTNGTYNNPKQLIERVRQIEAAPDVLGGVALSMAQGGSLGYLDEIVGAFGGDRDEVRRQVGSFRREFPKTALASEVAGAVALPGAAAFRTAGMAPTLAGRVATGAGIGAIEGGLAMAGERDPGTHIDPRTGELEDAPDSFVEDVVDRLPAAAIGTGVGGVVGAVAGSLERPIAKGVSKLLGRATKETPEMAANKFAQEAADATPRGREGILADLRAKQELVPEATLADVPEMRPVSQAASSVSKEARDVAEEVLPTRERSAMARIRSKLQSAMSSEDNTIIAHATSVEQRLADGQRAYQALEESVPSITSEPIEKMFAELPIMREAWDKAQKHATRLGQELQPLFVEVAEEGGTTVMVRNPDAVMDFRTMQAIKQQLANFARSAGRDFEGNAVDIWKQHASFYDEARRVIDGYGDTQRVYADLMDEKEAAQLGMSFVNKKASVVAEDIALMGPAELQAYKESAAVSFLDMLANRKRRGNIADLFNTDAMDSRLRVLLPDESSYDDFIRMLDVEEAMQATSKAHGGAASQTAEELRQKALEIRLPASNVERAAELAAHPAPALAGLRFLGAGRQARASEAATARAAAMGGPLQRGLLDPRFSGAQNLLRGRTMPTLLDLGRTLQSPRELVTLFGQGG